MIALVMLYAAVVGTVCAGGAWLAERAATSAGRAARWAWAGALALSIALPGAAVWRAAHDGTARRADDGGAAAERVDPSFLFDRRHRPTRADGQPLWRRAWLALPRSVAAPAEWGALDGGLIAVWATLTTGALARMGAAAGTTRRLTRAWPTRIVLGERVRVSDDLGPAVVGAWRTAIVLPRWALDDARLPLMLDHEREHVCAHDARLLVAGTLAAALVPWSPAAWWAVRRLRAAVEVDCDRRVLALHGASTARGPQADGDTLVRRYGALLLDVAARPPSGAPALTLGGTSTLLRRRIEAMLSDRTRAPRRAVVPALAATVVAVAACEIPKPTGPAPATRIPLTSIASVDPSVAPPAGPHATVEAVRSVIAARLPELLTNRTNRTQNVWIVQRADGTIERVAHAEAVPPSGGRSESGAPPVGGERDPLATIDPQSLASVEVLRLEPARVAQDGVNVLWLVRRLTTDTTTPTSRTRAARDTTAVARAGAHGIAARAPLDSVLVVVDGRIAGRGHGVLDTFRPDTIASVDVLKGALATQRYGDAGRAGVIVLTTRKPGGA